jgi:hypothetical protein
LLEALARENGQPLDELRLAGLEAALLGEDLDEAPAGRQTISSDSKPSFSSSSASFGSASGSRRETSLGSPDWTTSCVRG